MEEESDAETKNQNSLRLPKDNYEERIKELNSDYNQQFGNDARTSMERESKFRLDKENLMSEMKMEMDTNRTLRC